jgi:hypothetical protein
MASLITDSKDKEVNVYAGICHHHIGLDATLR